MRDRLGADNPGPQEAHAIARRNAMSHTVELPTGHVITDDRARLDMG